MKQEAAMIERAIQEGLEHHRAGRLPEAEGLYQRVLDADPNNPDALHLMGVIAYQVGKNETAVYLFDRALAIKPEHPEALSDRGNALKALGWYEEALSSYSRAIALRHDYVEALYNSGNALAALKRFDEALASYDRALAIKPHYAEALSNRGLALQELRRFEEALASYDMALSIRPDYAEVLSNRGNALHELKRFDEAISSYDRAVQIMPLNAEVLRNRGTSLEALRRFPEALVSYERALMIRPENVEALLNRGNVLCQLNRYSDALESYDRCLAIRCDYPEGSLNRGNALLSLRRYTDALESYDKALAIWPEYPEALSNRGNVLQHMGLHDEALYFYGKAISIHPEYAQAHYNRAIALQEIKRYDEALVSYERALEINPGYAEAFSNRGNVLRVLGRMEDAFESYKRALEIKPDYDVAHSNAIFVLDLMDGRGPEEQQAERRRWYSSHGRHLADLIKPHSNAVDADRKLRIGYVSPDFRRHAASFAFAPIIRLHDRSAFELVCYSGSALEDEVTHKLRNAAELWRSTVDMSDEDLAERVRADKIDILVDLSSHMAGNRLLVFSRKPAPVQVTAWGYPNGTGLPTMDYIFSDKVVVPEGERRLFAEEVIDLPCFLCYEPPEYLPEVAPLPALLGRPFTFGCVSRLEKISDGALRLWGCIMDALPEARLLIKSMALEDPEVRRRFIVRMEVAGIEREKVTLIGNSSHIELLETFHKVDLALDPFPHGGAIGTAETLWMGVPVVTLCGGAFMSRISASMLTALGMHEWIAYDEAGYVQIAVEASRNLAALEKTRGELRGRLRRSIFGDARGYTRAVESAYRDIWRRWCEQATTKGGY